MQRSTDDGRPAAKFRITDGGASVEVTYVGILPDLFREGQGVVTLGTLQPDGTFRASEVLAKHDETYMPKDVADALKKSGHWNPASGPPPPAATWNTASEDRRMIVKHHRGRSGEGGRMIPELGHFALALAVAIAGAQAVLPLWGAHRRDARLMAPRRRWRSASSSRWRPPTAAWSGARWWTTSRSPTSWRTPTA